MGTVVPLEELKTIREEFHRQKKVVVFTNGCFDIIHRGHIEYLTNARSLGDILIVGVNTDNSIKRIKGEKRPIVPEADRAFIVANLAPVDHVCLFDEDTPYELIRQIVPDVLVKGADWKNDDIVGKDIVEQAGGHVRTIPFISNRSTSTIIEQILKRFS
jgi:D-beta-D-heptose 7-phosphate kinase/D-beta-D-heptose 1-phosphate adenosyltransferase